MREWSLAFCLALVFSSLTAASIAFKLFRNGHLLRSTLRFVFFVFFVDLTLWSLFRAWFFGIILTDSIFDRDQDEDPEDTQVDPARLTLHQLKLNKRSDALGTRTIMEADTITNWAMTTAIVLGDTALIATTAWLFPMIHELLLLAKVAMDRGAEREKQVIRRYSVIIHVIVAAFLIVQVANTIYCGGYNGKVMFLAVIVQLVQIIVLMYITVALYYLKFKGRQYEHVHGSFCPSPLYRRIRNLMIVFTVFSLQYQVISIIYLRDHSLNGLPTWFIGISTLMFRCLGLALSFVIGCSQELVVESFHRFLPSEYTQAFDAQSHIVEVPFIHAPEKNPVFVFTDIESSSALWAIGDGSLMRIANELHDDILRSLLMKYRGYEITTVGDAFQLAFDNIKDAVEYCMEVQLTLLTAKWPKGLRECGVKATRCERVRGKCIFDGLRVRMGIHDANEEVEGALVVNEHPVTGKVTYTGLSEVIANEVGDYGCGGQIVVTSRVAEWLETQSQTSLVCEFQVEEVGQCHLKQLEMDVELFQLLLRPLQARKQFFTHKASSLSIAIEAEIAELSEYTGDKYLAIASPTA